MFRTCGNRTFTEPLPKVKTATLTAFKRVAIEAIHESRGPASS